MKLFCFTLLSTKTKSETKTKKTNKQTYTQAFSITYISMTLISCWKRPMNIWSNAWRIVQWSISKIFIPKQHQIRIANVILCTSYWKWQNPRIERIWWKWTAKDTNGLLVSLCPSFYMRMRGSWLSRFKKYLKYNYIPQPQFSVRVLDKRYSVTRDKFVFAFRLEVSSHFSLTSSKYFAPTRLKEKLGKSLSYEFNQCTVCATIRP